MKRFRFSSVMIFISLLFLASTVHGFSIDTDVQADIDANAPAKAGDVVVRCFSELTELQVDSLNGTYLQSAFKIGVEVTNTTGSPVYDVEVSVLPKSNQLKITGTNPVILAQRLDDGAPPVTAEWPASAGPRDEDSRAEAWFLVTFRDEQGNYESRTCSVFITLPAVPRPILDCSLSTSVTNGLDDNTISFDIERGDYEGENSEFAKYSIFIFTARIANIGDLTAKNVRATLLLPNGVTMEEGSTAIQTSVPADIDPGLYSEIRWKVRPLGLCTPQELKFEVLLTGENHLRHSCSLTATLAAAPCALSLEIPNDIVGVTGLTVLVPLRFWSNSAFPISRYRLMVSFDPALLRFVEAVPEESRTEAGWEGPQTELLARSGSTVADIVKIEDHVVYPNSAMSIHLHEEGVLLYLRFEVIFDPVFDSKQRSGYVNQSPLIWLRDISVNAEREVKASVNQSDESEYSTNNVIIFENGYVTVSGPCAWPLVSSARLLGNSPNPFNPTTTISYEIRKDMDVHLVVLDPFGRQLRVLESGYRAAGRHELSFDADNLPSGMYFYRLTTPEGSTTKRMLLVR